MGFGEKKKEAIGFLRPILGPLKTLPTPKKTSIFLLPGLDFFLFPSFLYL
jgi:hypothetical protein